MAKWKCVKSTDKLIRVGRVIEATEHGSWLIVQETFGTSGSIMLEKGEKIPKVGFFWCWEEFK